MERGADFEDGLGLAQAIRAGAITAEAALAAALARAEAVKELGAIRHLDATGAETPAPRDGNGAAPPFEGVPFLMKDLGVSVRGMPTVWGSLALRNRRGPAERDDAITARMRGAGLRIFGMTTICEFGQAPATEPAIGPIARNPLDPTRTPGGSSGGAAVAVASGIVALAHANDAAGSIRIPAACCGLVGLKPTRGATPWGPDFENFAAGYVSDFVVSRSLRDTAALLDAVAGRAGNPVPDPVIGPALARLDVAVAPLRIGLLLDGPDGAPVAAERRDAVAAAADVLAAAGHAVVPLDPKVVGGLDAIAAHAVGVVLSSGLARIIDGLEPPLAAGELEPLTLAAYRYGRGHSGAAVVEALIGGAKVAAGMAALFERVDVLLTPMLGTAPPPLGSFPTDHDDITGHNRRNGAFVPYGLLPNVAGLPALTLPHGADDAGLPLPVQLIGPMGADVLLLQLGRTLQRALPWSFATPLAGSSAAGPMTL